MIDNITFNVTTKPVPKVKQVSKNCLSNLKMRLIYFCCAQQAQPAIKKPNKKRAAASSGFDFQFNAEKPKVKALVVRRRAAPVVKETPKAATTTGKGDGDGDLMFNVIRPSKATPTAKTTPTTDGDLMFNVIIPSVTAAASAKPSAPAVHTAALDQELLNKAKEKAKAQAGKISKQQLKAALRGPQRKENPNKLPRAGDLFKAQLDEERRQRRAAEEPKEQNAEQATQEEPKNPVQAANKFRTKKIGLFDQSDVAALKQLGQRAVKPVKETIFSGSKVESLGLHAHAVKNLLDLLSISQLTTVQQKTIPQVLAGRDVLVRSQTGSGKTLAYALPVVERLQAQQPRIKRTDGVLALIIVPTRELAVQTYELFQKLVKPYTWIVPGALLGGESRKSEKARLRKGINVLLGTPGRLVDHLLHTASFRLDKLQFLILDEADRLLELGYERDVKQLVEAIDKQRAELAKESEDSKKAAVMQRMLLSATLTSQVQQLAGLTLKDPLYIDNSDEATEAALKTKTGYQKDTIEAVQQEQELDDGLGEYLEDVTGVLSIPENLQLSYVVVPPKLRLVTISALLAKELAASPKKFKAIVFMSTTEMVNFHHDVLNEALTQRILDEDDEELAKEQQEQAGDDAPLLLGLRFFK